jgi:ParB family chromosome partitioning protein
MANAIEKITLSAAQNIPFNTLVLSQQNVRKTRASLSIEDLAQDIGIADCSPASASGPHSTVMATRPASTAFPPGGALSRFRTLVAQKRLTRTASSPCIVRRGDTQEVEDPLAEGLQRVSLHPLDQFAFQASSRASASRSLPTMTSLAGTSRDSLEISRPAGRPPRRAESIKR